MSWFVKAQESEEAKALFQEVLDFSQRLYQGRVLPVVIERWRGMSEGELRTVLEHLRHEEKRLNFERQQRERWENDNKDTPQEVLDADAERTFDVFERLQSAGSKEHVLEHGLEALPMEDVDPALEGFWGICVGDAERWAPILVRDGDVDSDAEVFWIHTDESEEPFYIMEDPFPYDKDAVPSSNIIFSRMRVIPGALISFVRELRDIEPAPSQDGD